MQFGDEKSTLFSKGLAIIDMVVIGAGVWFQAVKR